MTPDPIAPELSTVLRRLKLGRLHDTLPERLVLARQQQMPAQDFLLLVLSDEVARRDSLAVTHRATQARLDPAMTLEQWDPSAKVTYDRALWNELVALRFLDRHAHVAIVGPVGVGKTFLAHTLGWLACQHGHTVLALTADKMLKQLQHARQHALAKLRHVPGQVAGEAHHLGVQHRQHQQRRRQDGQEEDRQHQGRGDTARHPLALQPVRRRVEEVGHRDAGDERQQDGAQQVEREQQQRQHEQPAEELLTAVHGEVSGVARRRAQAIR